TEILSHPRYRINIFADACRGTVKYDQPFILGSSLLAATLLNTVSRKTMQWFFKRYLFQHQQSPQIIGNDRFRNTSATFDASNLKSVILASGAIPLVVEGVKIPGHDKTYFRDGGLLDYHLTLNYNLESGLVLMPHFSPKLVTTWLDKYTPWRAPDTSGMENVVIITPSEEFIASLPYGKIPDRSDFKRFEQDDISRNQYWRECTERSAELASALAMVIESGEIVDKLEPLEALHP
ncbi:MAG: patatin-like phospholipase family protein, partial [Enterobacterales bacterium]|nr:patatin-like phospholipase family protein [Enterobacterales bacterium]